MTALNSALYKGVTWHTRFAPKYHTFKYDMFMLWLDLDELSVIDRQLPGFSLNRFNWGSFREADHASQVGALKKHVLSTANELGGELTADCKVFFLGHLRYLGCYFSPVNFYYIYHPDGRLLEILANVSNTPWNERHYYRVLNHDGCYQQAKTFTVSPFNPLDMQYHWQFNRPDEKLFLQIENWQQQKKIFVAGLQFKKYPLSKKNYYMALIRFPCMSVTMVTAIYWQALKIWLKGNPFLGHSASNSKSGE